MMITTTLTLVGVGVATVLLVESAYGRGFVTGVVAVSVFIPGAYLLAASGYFQRSAGVDAETWTSEILRKLDRRRWVVFDDLFFDGANVDHVLIGPRAVFVVETKYVSFGRDLEMHLVAFLRQAQWGARKVDNLLNRTKHRLGRRVIPVLFVWGPSHRVEGEMIGWRDGVLVAVAKGEQEFLATLEAEGGGHEPDEASADVIRGFLDRARQPAKR